MYLKSSRLVLLFIVLCSSPFLDAYADDVQKNIALRVLTRLYSGFTEILKYPFKKIGAATVEGAWENMSQRLNSGMSVDSLSGGSGAISADKLRDTQIKEIVGSFFKALSNATNPKDKEAAGAQFLKNLFRNGAIALGDLYNPDGEGREALKKIISTFREYVNEDGAIKELIQDMRDLVVDEVKVLFERFEELNLDGGAAKKAVRAAAHNVRDGVEDVGQALDQTSQKVVRNIMIGGIVLISSWFLWKHYDRDLRTPSLVLETSYKNYLQRFTGIFYASAQKQRPEMILSPELRKRLEAVAYAARTIHKKILSGYKNIRYRNLLLWGPPGTGKTMFARILAEHSDMDYVIMSGSSFSQYRQGEGITHMNKLFQWAKSAPTGGLIIFIDEAEAFLGGRASSDIASESYQLLTNFLNLTGERSDKIMLIFGTNHPEALDEAMKRRIDDSIEIPLPQLEERFGVLSLYRNKHMIDLKENSPEFIESVETFLNEEILRDISVKTAGLSGGELEGIINSIISEGYIAKDGCISKGIVESVVAYAVQKHESFIRGFA